MSTIETQAAPLALLSDGLEGRAVRYLAARRRSGDALLEAVAELAAARDEAAHGEWGPFLERIGLDDSAARGQLRIHELAAADPLYAERIRSGFLTVSTARELIALPADQRAELLERDAPPTRAAIRAASAANRAPAPDPELPAAVRIALDAVMHAAPGSMARADALYDAAGLIESMQPGAARDLADARRRGLEAEHLDQLQVGEDGPSSAHSVAGQAAAAAAPAAAPLDLPVRLSGAGWSWVWMPRPSPGWVLRAPDFGGAIRYETPLSTDGRGVDALTLALRVSVLAERAAGLGYAVLGAAGVGSAELVVRHPGGGGGAYSLDDLQALLDRAAVSVVTPAAAPLELQAPAAAPPLSASEERTIAGGRAVLDANRDNPAWHAGDPLAELWALSDDLMAAVGDLGAGDDAGPIGLALHLARGLVAQLEALDGRPVVGADRLAWVYGQLVRLERLPRPLEGAALVDLDEVDHVLTRAADLLDDLAYEALAQRIGALRPPLGGA